MSSFEECSYLQNIRWDREDHGFIKNGVGVIPFGGSLLLADLLAVLQEIHFDKRIWEEGRITKNIQK